MYPDNSAWSEPLLIWVLTLFFIGFGLSLIACNFASLTPTAQALARRPTQALHRRTDELCSQCQGYLIDKVKTAIGVNDTIMTSYRSKSLTSSMPTKSLPDLKIMPHEHADHSVLLPNTLGGATHGANNLPQIPFPAQNLTHTHLHTTQTHPTSQAAAAPPKSSEAPGDTSPLPTNLHSRTSEPPTITAANQYQAITSITAGLDIPNPDIVVGRTPRRSTRTRKQTEKGIASSAQARKYKRKDKNM